MATVVYCREWEFFPRKGVFRLKPYWGNEEFGLRLFLGDCLEVLPALEDAGERFDLCLTDPPYGVGIKYADYEDSEDELRRLIAGFVPLVRACSTVVALTPGITGQWLYPRPEWVLCWYYPAGAFQSAWGFTCWQPCLVYGRDPYRAANMGARPDSFCMTASSGVSKELHPCAKPVPVWERFMVRTSLDGASVIDPFCGSGTSLVAAYRLGRECTGVEISEEYCESIVARMEEELKQKRLFAPKKEEKPETIAMEL